MKVYQSLYEKLESTPIETWIYDLRKKIKSNLSYSRHSEITNWNNNIEKMPDISPSFINLTGDLIQIGKESDLSTSDNSLIEIILKEFHPWRKGPFAYFDLIIDTEWRSDFKWNRLKDHLNPLKDKFVLDIGSGNGYHSFRALGAGAKMVFGIEPYLKNVFQFLVAKEYLPRENIWVVPLGIEDMPHNLPYFDTVFSMGVMYHRRSPFDHLFNLRSFMKDGGELILETLVIDGRLGKILVPEDRYAKMRNVWFIPTCLTLESWLKRAGFKNIRLINVNKTTIKEQRSTPWMQYESLRDFLDPSDNKKTIEGYPAPKRAIVMANI